MKLDCFVESLLPGEHCDRFTRARRPHCTDYALRVLRWRVLVSVERPNRADLGSWEQ